MATKEQIFKVLGPCQIGLDRKRIGELIGEEYRHFQSQLNRWVKTGLLEEHEHHYLLTESGREELEKLEHPGLEESLKTTEAPIIQKQGAYFHLLVTQDDLNRLSEPDFEATWNSLGKIIRSRGQPLVLPAEFKQ